MSRLAIGQSESFSKTISEFDVYGFAGITGDFNPVHIDAISASKTKFKRRIAHGVLSVGFISAILGTKLPGQGTVYIEQNIKFTHPVYIGDTITANVTVQEIKEEKNIVLLRTICINQDGQMVMDGIATVLAPK
jgi:3-hydroxybutyryl-CoA dehydratase